LPKEFIGFKMEVGVGRQSGDFLPNHGNQLAVMKNSCVELLLPWMQHSFVERNIDLDWSFEPVSVSLFVFPTVPSTRALTPLFSTQLCINKLPIPARNILWSKIWVSNYLEEVLEARLRFLFPVIPIPFSQQKRRLVRIWVVHVDWEGGRDIHQIVGNDALLRIMVREASAEILPEKPKYIVQGFQDLLDLGKNCR
jgi:hypothetical protein